MTKKTLPYLLMFTLLATQPSWAQNQDASGVLMAASGEAFRVTTGDNGDEVLIALNPGDPIFSGDEIRTAEGAEIQVMMRDQSVFSMGSQSSLEINQFEFAPGADSNRLDLKINTGDIKILSGQIGAAENRLTVNIADAVVNLTGGDRRHSLQQNF